MLCVTSLVTALLAAKVMHYDMGTAAGLMAGAFTESTVIGTAGDAIRRLALPDAEEDAAAEQHPRGLRGELSRGHDVRGLVASSLAPRLLRVDIRKEARELEAALGGDEGRRRSSRPSTNGIVARTSRASGTLVGRTVRDIEKTFEAQRLFVERVRRDGEICDVGPDFRVGTATSSRSPAGAACSWRRRPTLGTEVEDTQLLAEPLVTRRRRRDQVHGPHARRGRHGSSAAAWPLRALVRGGQEIPYHEDTASSAATCCASPATPSTSRASARRSATSNVRRAKPTSCLSASAC